ncbi:hypothetical protein JRO89_XS03G0024600 [Xanthoceras sorbifolium]|uniref:LOB domain-containing protein n=1 Tax=Xanthoceras sorbifolium TaxID=99658 RepID=A0ABQ8I890_9ROSI|nr:hypothetical protein JRO89_XS03G0024600 [Xanthoceras sorbifolium]
MFGGTLKNIKIKMGRFGPNVISVTRTLMVRAVVEQHTSEIITIAAKKREMEIKPERAVSMNRSCHDLSSVVYEANARVHGQCMEHRCGETISRLQEQIDTLQTQLAVSQAEVVYQRALRQAASFSNYQVLSPTSTTKSASPSSSIDEPLWSC